MLLQRIAYEIKKFFGLTKSQKLLNELYDEINELQTEDLKEELYAKSYDLVETLDEKERGLEIDENKYQIKVDGMVKVLADAKTNDVFRQHSLPDYEEEAKRLAPLYAANAYSSNEGSSVSATQIKTFQLACEIDNVVNGVVRNFVGVQPMPKPVSHAHTLRVQYAGEEEIPKEVLEAKAKAQGISVDSLAETTGRRLNIRILKETVEARSRKCMARRVIQPASTDELVGDSIETALVQEVTSEIINGVLHEVTKHNEAVVSKAKTSKGVIDSIWKSASNIALRTRRGSGNWLIVGSEVAALIDTPETRASGAFTGVDQSDLPNYVGLRELGTLHKGEGEIRVYHSIYFDENVAFVGYKGQQEIDTGFIYNPYVPLQSAGVIMDSNTGELVETYINRAGYLMLEDDKNSLGNGRDYYDKIVFEKLKGE